MARSRRTVRRAVEWLGFETAPITETVDATSAFIVITAAQLSEYVHPTMVRLRAVLIAKFSGNTTVNTGSLPSLTIGVTIITAQAAAAGAVPVPDVDLDADWLYWDKFGVQGVARAAGDASIQERVIDSKAMRRIAQPDNAAIVLIGSVAFEAQTGTIRWNATGRILMKGD